MTEQELQEIERYTISGNDVPVTRVTLDAAEVRALIAEVRRLRKAIQPFAYFAHQYNQKPIGRMDDRIYSIHAGTEWEAELRRSDCQAALDLVGGLGNSPDNATAN